MTIDNIVIVSMDHVCSNGNRCTQQVIQFRSNTCLGFDDEDFAESMSEEYFVIQRFWWWKYVVGHISVVYTKYMIEESLYVVGNELC